MQPPCTDDHKSGFCFPCPLLQMWLVMIFTTTVLSANRSAGLTEPQPFVLTFSATALRRVGSISDVKGCGQLQRLDLQTHLPWPILQRQTQAEQMQCRHTFYCPPRNKMQDPKILCLPSKSASNASWNWPIHSPSLSHTHTITIRLYYLKQAIVPFSTKSSRTYMSIVGRQKQKRRQ